MSDDGLIRVTKALAKIRREVELLEVKCASAIHERSTTEVRSEGLAGRLGFSSPQRLIASTTGAASHHATKLIEVARATESRERFGEALPPRFPAVASAVAAGTLSVDAAHSITRFLGRVAPGVDHERVRWAEEALVERSLPSASTGSGTTRSSSRRNSIPSASFAMKPRCGPIANCACGKTLRAWSICAAGSIRSTGPWSRPRSTRSSAPRCTTRATRTRRRGWRPRRARATGEWVTRLGGGAGGDAADVALADTRTLAQMSADALADIARLALSSDDAPPSLAAATVVARITVDELESGIGFGELDGIEMPVSAASLRELAATADVIPEVLGGCGEVLDLGRRRRRFTRAQRIALAERDGGCAHPDCDRPPAYTQAHHIKWWTRQRGPTDLDNGVLLCSFHHHLVHDTGWGIFVRDHQVWFVPPAALDPEQRPRPGRQARRRELIAMAAA